MPVNCCKANKKRKTCKRKSDGKIFHLPRRFTRKRCSQGVKGFTMRSSCAPYKDCQKGGGKIYRATAVISNYSSDPDMKPINGIITHLIFLKTIQRVKIINKNTPIPKTTMSLLI